MGDMGDYWRDVRPDMRKKNMEKRASNRESSAKMLADSGVAFETKNSGAHLIVTASGRTVDFWPGTGLWIERGTSKQKRGVRRLIAELKNGAHAAPQSGHSQR
jgi:hypothetical protein